MLQHHPGCADGGDGVNLVFAGIARRGAVNRFKHRDTLRVQIAGGGDAHAALNHRTQVGDNIAEHITRHDDIKPLRVFHHPHRRSIDKGVFLLNIGEILADFVEDALPEIVRERQYVRLIAKR